MNHAVLGLLAHIGAGPAHDLSHGLENPWVVAACAGALAASAAWAAHRTRGEIWRAPVRFITSLFTRTSK